MLFPSVLWLVVCYQTRISFMAAWGIGCFWCWCWCCLWCALVCVSTNFTFGDSLDIFSLTLFSWLHIVSALWSCCVDTEHGTVPAIDTVAVVVVERIGGRGGILFVLLDDALHPPSINVALPFGKFWWVWCSNPFCLDSKNKLKNCLNNFG